MRNGAVKNKRTFWYLPFVRSEDIRDEYLNLTGQQKKIYGEPVEAKANISPAGGVSQTEMFGNIDNYDKVISPLPANFPITENDVLFIDKEPEYNKDGDPVFDYKVRRVARSLNRTSVAVTKVSQS